jgi:hypothetical protein
MQLRHTRKRRPGREGSTGWNRWTLHVFMKPACSASGIPGQGKSVQRRPCLWTLALLTLEGGDRDPEPARELTVEVAAHQETDARHHEARNKVNDQRQVKKRCKIDHLPSPLFDSFLVSSISPFFLFSCFVRLTTAGKHISRHGDRKRRASCPNRLKTVDLIV